jgi:hypothetical protein
VLYEREIGKIIIERNCRKKKKKRGWGGCVLYEREMRELFDIRVITSNLYGLGPSTFSNIKANFCILINTFSLLKKINFFFLFYLFIK